MIMARASTPTPPGHITSDGGLAGATETLHRMLFDSCEAVRILDRLPGGTLDDP